MTILSHCPVFYYTKRKEDKRHVDIRLITGGRITHLEELTLGRASQFVKVSKKYNNNNCV